MEGLVCSGRPVSWLACAPRIRSLNDAPPCLGAGGSVLAAALMVSLTESSKDLLEVTAGALASAGGLSATIERLNAAAAFSLKLSAALAALAAAVTAGLAVFLAGAVFLAAGLVGLAGLALANVATSLGLGLAAVFLAATFLAGTVAFLAGAGALALAGVFLAVAILVYLSGV